MTDYDRVREVAAEIDKHLRADDPRLRHIVELHHEDGSRFWYNWAYIMLYYDPQHGEANSQHPGEWVMVFTEHQGTHVFQRDEVTHYAMYKQTEVFQHHAYPEPRLICNKCRSVFIEPCMAITEGPCCPFCYERDFHEITDDERSERYDLLGEYLKNVAAFVLGEKVLSVDYYSDLIKVGAEEKEPDEGLMRKIERSLEIPEQGVFDFRQKIMAHLEARRFRQEPISKSECWRILRKVCDEINQ
jgi:hypothetical protein